MLRGVFGIALCITDCNSDSQRTGKLAVLPNDVIDLVVDHVVLDMRDTKQGGTVAALMHVSSLIRYKLAKLFAPVKLYTAAPPRVEQEAEVLLPEDFEHYIPSVIRWHLFDASMKRHGAAAPSQQIGTEALLFKAGAPVRNLQACVAIKTERLEPEIFKAPALAERSGFFLQDNNRDASRLTYILNFAFEQCQSGRQDADGGGDFPPRVLNVHQRALLSGSLGDPVAAVAIDISMILKAITEDPESKWYTRKWKFVTKAARS